MKGAMKTIRHALCAVAVVAALLAPSVRAASFTTDQSDLWYIPAESGWGMQLVQRNSTIFATLFVYAQSTNPTWYVATMNPTPTSFQWSGDLYATTGPWFGTVPFNPGNVTATRVGTMTWTGTRFVTTGNVSYTVGDVAISKNVVRQTLFNENYSGHFGGGFHQLNTGCANTALNTTIENIGVVDIAQTGTTVTIATVPTSGARCSYSGTLIQFGQMGDVTGAFSCNDGSGGFFHAFELQVTELSFIGRFTASYTTPTGCQATGWFGGLTVTTF